ncbi:MULTISPECIES: ABC transporter ATP-binding protein [Mycolicibacterium]|jgi:sulfonate transport system ATP-binding protein|uniref:ABC transporter ATP-binding protein n=3 Tax=Mycolicibacterium fortuitum TaxID=1766 RepID=A0AAE4VER4_MYCFO|nr:MULTISPECIES: ABC transporter ATP-binding protein [Mycolicibacterium]AIY48178.1 Alkanesulfonates ABC transporter ATP-binding protein [Mycobacterium sp. VKM Ac-1817D]CRL81936.1 ABC transporter-like protein [Mycolicibacter nonchromogenicus]EJZ09089.1 nitrate/sulfonate/bicarbonate ABC transporter ATPase [Mycolicibacterium fortuitum subsp. fortuitum DSM 46621 = ATCC 6841 = JCM 6387]MBP3083614.1 ABC transporter ATP-binding protein [Mycolicibacterium fortuitum]MCA4754620.1 ABC transporter ATP-bin
MSSPVVEVRGLRRAFGDQQVLGDLELQIADGEFVAMLGRSGSGKSTLLRVLAGLDDQVTGSVRVPRSRAVVFQNPRLLPWRRALANVTFALPDAGPDAPSRTARGHAALQEVGLAEKTRAWPLSLSGGEAQRVSLARALVREPDLLLLDEPFGALDALTRLKMYGLLHDLWARRHMAVLHVTHDVDEAILLADRVVVLSGGKVSLDVRVELPFPRTRSDDGFDDLRRALLEELGVREEVGHDRSR